MGFHAIPALIPVSRAGKIDRHLGRDDFPMLAPGWITGFDAHFKARPNQVDLSLPNTWHWQLQHKVRFSTPPARFSAPAVMGPHFCF